MQDKDLSELQMADGPRGGKLLRGGKPGNRGGGRLPSQIRQTARALLSDELLEHIQRIALGFPVSTMILEAGELTRHFQSPAPARVQLQAATILIGLAVGSKYEILVEKSELTQGMLEAALSFIPQDRWDEFYATLRSTITEGALGEPNVRQEELDLCAT